MDNLKQNILVTGGGAPGAPGIINALKSDPAITIFSCDFSEETPGKHLAHGYFRVPMGDDPNYIKTVTEECKKHTISTIFPITTKELLPLSLAKTQLKSMGIDVIVSDPHDLEIANNKGKLYDHLRLNSIETPEYFIVSSVDSFIAVAEELGYPSKPFIFKPCVANGSRGFRIVSADVDEHNLLFNAKPSHTYISLEKAVEILSMKSFPELLISEYLPGDEYTVDCLVSNGRTEVIIPRKRLKMNNGISVEGIIENNQKVIDYCEAILSTLKLDGPIGIQVKFSENNVPLLVEINPRIQGTSIACLGAGINIPLLTIRNKMEPSSASKNLQSNVKWGVHFVRHYSELYYD
ncbi:MAG: ATP-grasp domain-containing protein [Bacteroidia bacterium]|nr:ATP-grasp domain-containing protein [Bacteroidia bacterium]